MTSYLHPLYRVKVNNPLRIHKIMFRRIYTNTSKNTNGVIFLHTRKLGYAYSSIPVVGRQLSRPGLAVPMMHEVNKEHITDCGRHPLNPIHPTAPV